MISRNCLFTAITISLILATAMPAGAASVTFGRSQTGDYDPTKWDDVGFNFSPWNLDASPTNGYILNGDRSTTGRVVLFAVADLFTLLPGVSSGDDLVIDSASMDIMTQWNSGNTCNATLSRITTDWLLYGAGTNESNVNWDDRDVSDANTAAVEWATAPDGIAGQNAEFGPTSWGLSDYTSTNAQTTLWTGGWDFHTTWNITDLLADAYAAGENYGWLLSGDYTPGGYDYLTVATSETPGAEPQLIIDYHYETPVGNAVLTVISGNGGGEHQAGLDIPISGGVAPAGMEFNIWVGDVDNIADIETSATTINMPHADTTITATWKAAGVPTDWWPTSSTWHRPVTG